MPDAANNTGEVLIVTGMSGAGRSTVANALEDLDWYVVDNLPPQMLRPLLELSELAGGAVRQVPADGGAVVRGGGGVRGPPQGVLAGGGPVRRMHTGAHGLPLLHPPRAAGRRVTRG